MDEAEQAESGSSAGRVRANLWLLGLNFGLLAGAAFLPAGGRDTAERLLLTGIFLATLAVHGTRIRWRLAVVAGLIAAQWGAKLAGGHELALAAGLLNGVFFLYVISRLAVQVAGAREVTRLVLLEAVNVYLLVGLVFSLLAATVAGAWPGAYAAGATGAVLGPGTDFHVFVYYAFITMATVGYGDIVPVLEPARALAVLMAVTGPLYMALVIAVLVGKFAGSPRRE